MTSTPPAGELNDDALAQEIDLLSDLVLAAGGVDRALTEPEVDLALGLHPQLSVVTPPSVGDAAAPS